ncbi:MAG TPA: DinB family protein [Gemmatimonadaceae bacterium]
MAQANTSAAVRELLGRSLAWEDAHAAFDKAVRDMPENLRGTRPEGWPHSAWELLEHLRLVQCDILDFCRNANYVEPHWPDDYWPKSPAPPARDAWDRSVDQFVRDRAALQALVADPATDLFAPIPHGSGQTILREIILVVDHTAYHVGQLIMVRRALGAWRGA